MISWWQKQEPTGSCHDDYSTGFPENKFCAICHRVLIVTHRVKNKKDKVEGPPILSIAEAQALLRSARFL